MKEGSEVKWDEGSEVNGVKEGRERRKQGSGGSEGSDVKEWGK